VVVVVGGGGGATGRRPRRPTPLADQLAKRDASEVWRGAPSYVQQVLRTTNADGLAQIRVELSQVRVPEIGDKFASLHAQKSVIGDILSPEDMPYTEDGTRPDIIINPFCLPSRMTIGQLEEMFWGRALLLGADRRQHGDATAFRATNVSDAGIQRLFAEYGYSGDGTQLFYNPVTGAQLEARGATGPVYMTKQRHMAADKLNTRGDSGPVEPITGQPVEGRRRCGGQRFGSMEIDAMVVHGASAALYSRIPRSSDYLPHTPVCQRCRAFAHEDARTKKLHCTTCGHGHHVYYVATHRAFKVLSAETTSIGVRPGLVISPIRPAPRPLPAPLSSASPRAPRPWIAHPAHPTAGVAALVSAAPVSASVSAGVAGAEALNPAAFAQSRPRKRPAPTEALPSTSVPPVRVSAHSVPSQREQQQQRQQQQRPSTLLARTPKRVKV